MSSKTKGRCKWLAVVIFCCLSFNLLQASESTLKTADIRIRDPFIYADQLSNTYYMYAQSANRMGSNFVGVEVYTSKDLVNWNKPRPVLKLPDDTDILMVWAPEMHVYKGKFYLFVTLTSKNLLPVKKPVEKETWPKMHIRGTHIFHANSPLGPFKPFKNTSHTPKNLMALDGTLFVEEAKPYMIYCHEWVQTIDGTMEYIRLKDDLSDTIGKPHLLFKASDAPDTEKSPENGNVTDGCFIYKSPKSGRLFMIWSTFIPGKEYCVVLTYSESGKILGPWKKQKAIYTHNGGHGMIFRSFDGRLLMALHQPNIGKMERLHLFQITDNGKTLTTKNEVNLNGSVSDAAHVNPVLTHPTSNYQTVWTAPPGCTPANHSVDGPLMGNGNLGLCLSGPPENLRFFLSKNDFWRLMPHAGQAGPRVFGYLDIAVPSPAFSIFTPN